MNFEERKNEKIFYLKLQNNPFADKLDDFYNSRIYYNKLFGNYVFLEDMQFPVYMSSLSNRFTGVEIYNIVDNEIVFNEISISNNMKICYYWQKIMDFNERKSTYEDIIISFMKANNIEKNKERLFSKSSCISLMDDDEDILSSSYMFSTDLLYFKSKDDCKNFWIKMLEISIKKIEEM